MPCCAAARRLYLPVPSLSIFATTVLATTVFAMIMISCASKNRGRPFGKTPEGEPVDLYTLTGGKGMEATISTYGGVIVSLTTPDRTGKPGDVVLGFDTFDGYLKPPPYFGAIIGRYGNRIGHAK